MFEKLKLKKFQFNLNFARRIIFLSGHFLSKKQISKWVGEARYTSKASIEDSIFS
jgi:hypothetical protein